METFVIAVKDFWLVAGGFFIVGALTSAYIIANFSEKLKCDA